MRAILILARMTFVGLVRDRILYGIIAFAALLFGLSAALGQLSFAEQARITSNFGLFAIHMVSVVLAIFVGSTLVAREIEKKTILTLLAHPLSRFQFVLGKTLGLGAVIFLAIGILSAALSVLLLWAGLSPNGIFLVVLYGVLLEALLLLGVTIFFGSFSSAVLSVSFSVGVFLIGHGVGSLKGHGLFTFLKPFIPRLEVFNWRAFFIYGDPVPLSEIVEASLYAGVWFFFLVFVASLFLERRDF